jgi:hypothetical protein
MARMDYWTKLVNLLLVLKMVIVDIKKKNNQ